MKVRSANDVVSRTVFPNTDMEEWHNFIYVIFPRSRMHRTFPR